MPKEQLTDYHEYLHYLANEVSLVTLMKGKVKESPLHVPVEKDHTLSSLIKDVLTVVVAVGMGFIVLSHFI
jgi:hypothetical protein